MYLEYVQITTKKTTPFSITHQYGQSFALWRSATGASHYLYQSLVILTITYTSHHFILALLVPTITCISHYLCRVHLLFL